MSTASTPLPNWISYGLLPLLNVVTAFLISGLVVWSIGENPLAALRLLIEGALGRGDAIGFTLFYTTSFIFTGLSVAVAFHAGLFNIGSEGQAYIGGLGAALVALALDRYVPWYVTMPFAVIGAALFGAAWAFIPAWLQAKRGSHVVITTIMFNFLAASLMVYLIVNVLIAPGSMAPETREFTGAAHLPGLGFLGFSPDVPVNLALPLALLCAFAVWLLVWRTPWGYGVRVSGVSPAVAAYAGIDARRQIVLVMALSGALASGVAVNELLGAQHKLLIGFTGGYGFTGIAVALMGRNHPFGTVLAALLFGALTQGGAELAFEMPDVPAQMVIMIQGLVILFTGALGNLFRPALARLLSPRRVAA